MRDSAASLAFVAMLALGITPGALGADSVSPSQPSAIDRLVRQEDARRAELAAYDRFARQHELASMLDARERAMVAGLEAVAPAVAHNDRLGIDPAIRTAMLVRVASGPTSGAVVSATAVGEDAFAWGAAALGLGAGVAAMCVLLGCVTLVRSHGRLRSV
jgi:hypothetical protein